MQWAWYTRLPPSPDVLPGARVSDYLIAIPNGGHRLRSVAAQLKAQGVKAGVSDLALPLARGGCHGLWLELKVAGGRATAQQLAWLERVTRAGYRGAVAVGYDAAIATLWRYVAELDP